MSKILHKGGLYGVYDDGGRLIRAGAAQEEDFEAVVRLLGEDLEVVEEDDLMMGLPSLESSIAEHLDDLAAFKLERDTFTEDLERMDAQIHELKVKRAALIDSADETLTSNAAARNERRRADRAAVEAARREAERAAEIAEEVDPGPVEP